MKKTIHTILLSAVFLAVSCGGNQTTSNQPADKEKSEKELLAQAQNLFKPLPNVVENSENPISDEKTALGKLLYFDTRLSKTGNNSCNSCHNLATFGVDNLATSPGDAGKNGERNSPTTLNAALHFVQFWDGRAKNLEEQAGGPILNPGEMAMPDEKTLLNRLKSVAVYKTKFAAAYPNDKDPITYKNLTHAIAAFERTLCTPGKFDTYLNGDINALSIEEKEGLKTFMSTGCTACHNGAALGGNQFMKFGLINNYRPLTKSKKEDLGRIAVTKQESDKDVFKVPGLRNIAKTHPYFHDGSVNDLSEAIKIMAKTQLNKDLTETEINNIVKFLEALTTDLPDNVKQLPKELALN